MSISDAFVESGARSAKAGTKASVVDIDKRGIERGSSPWFWASKRVFDVVVSFLGLPIVAGVGFVLLFANPFRNPGPVLFSQ